MTRAVKYATQVLAPLVRSKKKAKCDVIRSLVQPIVGPSIMLDSVTLASIMRGVKAQVNAGLVPPTPQLDQRSMDQFRLFSGEGTATGQCQNILDELVSQISTDESWIVTRFMENLKKANHEYFAYRCHFTHDDMIDGVVWQNGTSRAMLQKHGQRGFFDM